MPGETGRFVLVPNFEELGGSRNSSRGISWSGARGQHEEFREDLEGEEEGSGDISATERKGERH